ncbi:uncharacterized protein AMSG_04686 [Thecamonas trahens ATCC 50062]|uniref:Uncharacterized protein n=1 Tax=Thecamonas trahens ATCC 50062 TaxID=461836 RepID=A0A0L0DA20_THETB|nr:hypothetical protein AMSG_04686 [Thecamonas trahens ATCC 50062]KNC48941.1 hypothetical protein AMSG_04686 [Thecamonas trahens ATCC 50062]|eukprot:XP_013758358.1 hypothetical protein AMSG_04686 [Thecamonas trahens ATCC 50062]
MAALLLVGGWWVVGEWGSAQGVGYTSAVAASSAVAAGRRASLGAIYGRGPERKAPGADNGCSRKYQAKFVQVSDELAEYRARGMAETPNGRIAADILYAGLGLETARKLARLGGTRRKAECVMHAPDGRQTLDRTSLTTGPELCVVVRTYEPKRGQIPALLHSLFASRYANMTIFLAEATVPGPLENPQYLDELAAEVDDCRVVVAPANNDVSFEASGFACLGASRRGYGSPVGYLRTEAELARVLNLRSPMLPGRAACDYVLITNGDNLYSADFVPAILPHLNSGIDFVHVDFTTHHVGHKLRTDGAIDLGAAVISTRLLNPDEPNFVVADLITEPKGMFDADSRLFARLLADPKVSVAYIPAVLFTHQ